MYIKLLMAGVLSGLVSIGHAIDWSGYKNARTLEREKRYDEAIAVYEQMSDKTTNEKDDQQYMLWAIEAAKAKKDAAAVKRLAERVKHPDRKQFVQMRTVPPAEIIEKNGKVDFKQWPEDIRSDAFALRGSAAFALKQYDDALRDYEEALSTPGGNIMYKGGAARVAGSIYEQRKNPAKAEEFYRKALALSKADYAWRNESLIALSRLLIAGKRAQEACQLFDPTARLAKLQGYWGIQLNSAYAAALAAADRKTDALKTLDIVLKLTPEKNKANVKKQIDKLSEELL